MASRSFNPTSYLQMPSRDHRPSSSIRRPSSSSALSTTSEDSIVSTLKALSVESQQGKENSSGGGASWASSACSATPGNPVTTATSQSFPETPGKKRSKPIPIELPARNRVVVYTPLSARGDLLGGYFPNHEETTGPYKTHPFSSHNEYKPLSGSVSPGNMSSSSSVTSSPTLETTPRSLPSIISPPFQTSSPDALIMSMGKYHPSNYKSQATSSVSIPSSSFTSISLPLTNLAIPTSTGKRNTNGRPGHERNPSDVKRKLQLYQRDMIAQARNARVSNVSITKATLKEPIRPRLVPAGSPGPITPFELEESAGYLLAGSRSGNSLIGSGAEREREMVGLIIRREEQRRQNSVGRV